MFCIAYILGELPETSRHTENCDVNTEGSRSNETHPLRPIVNEGSGAHDLQENVSGLGPVSLDQNSKFINHIAKNKNM